MERNTAADQAPSGPLPAIATAATPAEVMERLRTASKRGRLPGFEAGETSFSVSAHGQPFDGRLLGHCAAAAGGSRLTFEIRMLRKLPVIFAIVLAATVWPGVYFMDELIAQLIPGWWRPWVTYYWYLPLAILPIPFLWRSMMRKSERSMRKDADEMLGRIATEVRGQIGA